MPPLINHLVFACFVISAVFALVDALRVRSAGRFLLEVGLLGLAAVILHVSTGFPQPARVRSFGSGTHLLWIVGLLFLCIILGMAARYFFYLRGRFVWMSFVRPLCISPIVLLPLVGTLQEGAALGMIQVISLSLLAFQNGFFWRAVFERAQANQKV